jgi:hypothetical protein
MYLHVNITQTDSTPVVTRTAQSVTQTIWQRNWDRFHRLWNWYKANFYIWNKLQHQFTAWRKGKLKNKRNSSEPDRYKCTVMVWSPGQLAGLLYFIRNLFTRTYKSSRKDGATHSWDYSFIVAFRASKTPCVLIHALLTVVIICCSYRSTAGNWSQYTGLQLTRSCR